MFDEQFLHGNDIFGHCQKYRGAQIEASHLLNLSRSFARMMKENHQAAKRFQEKPLEGCTVFAKDQEGSPSAGDELTRREQHLQKKFGNVDSHGGSQPGKGANQNKQQKQKEETKKQVEQPKKQ